MLPTLLPPAVSSVAGRTGAVTIAQADVSGLTTASSPTFAGLTTTGTITGGIVAATGAGGPLEHWSGAGRTGTRDFAFYSGGSGLGVLSTFAIGFAPTDAVTIDTMFWRDAAGIMAQRNSTTAQKQRVYSTWTDASNGAWGEIDLNTANTLIFGSNGNGTGASTLSKFQLNILGVNKLDYGVTIASVWSAAGSIVAGSTAKGYVGGDSVACYLGSYTNHAVNILINNVNKWQFTTGANFVPAGITQATTMTNGFINIPGAAGAPTGVPSSTTGFPLYYDSTNNKLYAYNGAWVSVTLA